MRHTLLAICAIFLSIALPGQPINAKRNHHVIIDTDCAIDDFRAISLLLSRPEVTIDAILVSDGSLPPSEGFNKVKALLLAFGHLDIPVATGIQNLRVSPPWRNFNLGIQWGPAVGKVNGQYLQAMDCFTDKLENSSEPIVFICLGSLTHAADLIRNHRTLLPKIERIIWYNESLQPLSGFNAECDTSAARFVLNAGVRIDIISNLGIKQARFDKALVEVAGASQTPLAATLHFVFNQSAVQQKLDENHFALCDDLLVFYLTNPELFNMNILRKQVKVRFNEDYDIESIRQAYSDMILGNYVIQDQIVFSRFPDQKEMFRYDVRTIMDSVIAKYGFDEWKANVMTDEFHGHLGVFSIVGAKMGIKAREIFGVGPDVLRVVSDAGSKPPYSCLNDGIQVSTGSTFGMGLISLSDDTITRPSAVFSYNNRSVRLTLKSQYLRQVNSDINEGIVKFGLSDDGYWKLVRRNAIRYWLEWDRNTIFEVEEKGME